METDAATRTTVVKLGGSLLKLRDLPERMRRAMEILAIRRPLLIAGGGPTADLVRNWDRCHQLGDERAHWLALQSLKLNETLLAHILPEAQIVCSLAEAETVWFTRGWPILCAYDFLRDAEALATQPLPHHWGVTSDSIAAWISIQCAAGRLVLFKSVSWTGDWGDVDPCFPQIARGLSQVEWFNLRDDDSVGQRIHIAEVI